MLTEDGRHALCDGGCKKAVAVDSPFFGEWETIDMEDGVAHLCARCQGRRDRGIPLALDYLLECARCGRNTHHNPEVKDWRRVPGPPELGTTGPGPLGDRPRTVTVCLDCFDRDKDVFVT